MSKSSVAVSWHPAAKQFVRYVGQSIGRNGKSKPHCFYLGTDEPAALATAARLRSDWAALKAAGTSIWPTTYLAALRATRVAQVITAGPLLTGQTVQVATAAETVDQVRAAFLAEQRQRMEAGQLAKWSYSGIADRLTAVLDRLPLEIAVADKPMRAIGEDQVRAVAFHWASLPVGKVHNQDKRPTTGKYVGLKPKGAPARVRRTEGKRISPLYATHQRDAIHSAWRHLVVNAGIRRLSFGKLRKTGAWMTKENGGLEVSEMYLAHGEPGMNKHYAGRDWGRLDFQQQRRSASVGFTLRVQHMRPAEGQVERLWPCGIFQGQEHSVGLWPRTRLIALKTRRSAVGRFKHRRPIVCSRTAS